MFVAVQIYALTLHVRIFGGNLKEEMKSVMARNYHGDNGTDRVTMSINNLFMRFNCCVIDDYSDLQTAPWNRQYQIRNASVEFRAPYFCCLINCTSSHTYCNTKRTPRIDHFNTIDQVECAVKPNETNSNFMKGCYKILKSGLASLFICNIVFIVIEVGTMILAIYFYRTILKHENDSVDTPAINTSVKEDILPGNNHDSVKMGSLPGKT